MRLPSLICAASMALGLASAARTARAAVWSNAGFATPPRNGHMAARLEDGRVLVAGGAVADGNFASTLIFDPKTTSWTKTAPMYEGRALSCMVTLDDGRVLVAGGSKKELEGSLASAELYTPGSNTWTAAAPMKVARFFTACTRLADGRVLVAGGAPTPDTDSADLEIYDPKTDGWTTGPSMAVARHNPRAVLLPSGHVLVVGAGSVEEYDPIANAWQPSVAVPLGAMSAAALVDGKVLLVGTGTPGSYVYDSETREAKPLGATNDARGLPRLVTLPNGHVLAVGGVGAGGKELRTAEIFDPKAGAWTATDPLPDGTGLHTATPLADGRVLVVGAGTSAVMPAQIFNGVLGTACDHNEKCASGYCTDGVCCNTPCAGACQACDSAENPGTCGPISGAPKPGHASCAPYLTCTAGACDATCAKDEDCSPGNVCFADRKVCGPDKDLCGPNDTLVDRKTGQATSCAPYTCSPLGECLTACATSLDCASGHVCGGGVCQKPAVPTDDGSGCAMGAPRTGGTIAALFGAFALLAARRRRPRARRRGALAALGLLSLLAFVATGCDASSAEPATEAPSESLARTESALEWSTGGTMKEPVRVYHTATPLDDGRVVVVAGSGAAFTTLVEAFDPKTETWSELGALKRARAGHRTTKLQDGRLLVTGGRDTVDTPFASAEVFDPASGTSVESLMSVARQGHVAVALDDGRVLVAGGFRTKTESEASAEIFDPKTGAWSKTSPMAHARGYAAGARLDDGRVLVVGGLGAERSAEIWDPKTGAWTAAPDAPTARNRGALLPGGPGKLVLVAGTARAVDVFDMATGTWRTGARPAAIGDDAATVVLPSGRVLVLGGIHPATEEVYDSYEIYDPIADAWGTPGRMTVPRFAHAAAVLPSGRTLVVGGLGTLDDTYPLFGPPEILNLSQGAACTTSSECVSNFCVDGRCCNTWCAGPCDACDLPGLEGTCSPVTGPPRPARDDGPKRPSCAPYGVCLAGACATSCGSDDYCDDEHVCNTATQTCIDPIATCDGASTVTDKLTGETKSCAPYKCQKNGSCLAKCATSDDCASGSLCDGNTCRPAVPTDDAGGCAVAMRAPGGGVGGWLALAAGLIVARRSRRARG